MRKVKVTEQVELIGEKNFSGKKKRIDFYIAVPGREKMYAFTKTYTHTTYNMCKTGIRVSQLITKRTRDSSVMRLVNYLYVIMPYLTEYYDLPVAS